jgi:hypothetical protein
VSNLVNNEYNE